VGDGEEDVTRRTFVAGSALAAAVAASHAVVPAYAADPQLAAKARKDATMIPGSKRFASMLAFGDFYVNHAGKVRFLNIEVLPNPDPAGDEELIIRCAGIQGISGVVAANHIEHTTDGRPKIKLTRILTHFQWDDPPVLIEQNPYRESWGELIGDNKGGVEALLPGTMTFYQHLILTAYGVPLYNPDPLIMTADHVDNYPPVGSTFTTTGPTDFYEVSTLVNVDELGAKKKPHKKKKRAHLQACANQIMPEIVLPQTI